MFMKYVCIVDNSVLINTRLKNFSVYIKIVFTYKKKQQQNSQYFMYLVGYLDTKQTSVREE